MRAAVVRQACLARYVIPTTASIRLRCRPASSKTTAQEERPESTIRRPDRTAGRPRAADAQERGQLHHEAAEGRAEAR